MDEDEDVYDAALPDEFAPLADAGQVMRETLALVDDLRQSLRRLGDTLEATGLPARDWRDDDAWLDLLSERLPALTLDDFLTELTRFAADEGPHLLRGDERDIGAFAADIRGHHESFRTLGVVAQRLRLAGAHQRGDDLPLAEALASLRVSAPLNHIATTLRDIESLLPFLAPLTPREWDDFDHPPAPEPPPPPPQPERPSGRLAPPLPAPPPERPSGRLAPPLPAPPPERPSGRLAPPLPAPPPERPSGRLAPPALEPPSGYLRAAPERPSGRLAPPLPAPPMPERPSGRLAPIPPTPERPSGRLRAAPTPGRALGRWALIDAAAAAADSSRASPGAQATNLPDEATRSITPAEQRQASQGFRRLRDFAPMQEVAAPRQPAPPRLPGRAGALAARLPRRAQPLAIWALRHRLAATLLMIALLASGLGLTAYLAEHSASPPTPTISRLTFRPARLTLTCSGAHATTQLTLTDPALLATATHAASATRSASATRQATKIVPTPTPTTITWRAPTIGPLVVAPTHGALTPGANVTLTVSVAPPTTTKAASATTKTATRTVSATATAHPIQGTLTLIASDGVVRVPYVESC